VGKGLRNQYNAPHVRQQQGLAMILTTAERQLIRIIRTAGRHDLTLTVRVRDGRYTVRITTYDDGGPGAGLGHGESFDAAVARRDRAEGTAGRVGATTPVASS
jgi:hypothetical protein